MRPTRFMLTLSVLVAVLAGTGTAGCGPGARQARDAAGTGTNTATEPGTATATATAQGGERSCAQRVLSGMNVAQRVGQLFMAGVDATQPTGRQLRMITEYHLGGVILTGGSQAGVDAVREVTDTVRARATSSSGVGPWISADQEGGHVQHLEGPGFSDIPTALRQGGLSPATLRERAEKWGGELRRAGVDVNLAPVMDTVPADLGRENRPIGYYHREYGHTPRTVADHGTAFQAGMRAAGVQPAVKHFPGLGRVRENTDTSGEVVDDITTRDDAYLTPFQAAVDEGDPLVMLSSARYIRIDAHHLAVFSPTVLRTMLRGDLGFDGVILSDDLGAAAAVQDVPPGERALRFLTAGGTMVLTVDPATVPEMYHAVLNRARADADFHDRVRAEAFRVLRAKHRSGLLPCA